MDTHESIARALLSASLDNFIDSDGIIKCCVEAAVAQKAAEMLKAQEATDANTGKWISVKDRMPKKSGKYLIVAVEQGRIRHVTTAMFGTFFYMTGRMTHWRVTYWMPLPDMPKEE